MTHIEKASRPVRFSAEHRLSEGIRVVALRGEIDHDAKDALCEALLLEEAPVPLRTVVDLSGVTFMDSSGIDVFVAAFRQASGTGGWVRVAGAQESVLRVFHLVGLDTLISCHPTTEQALTV